jgi:Caspase domain/inactive STAND
MGEQESVGQVSGSGKYFALLVGVNKYADSRRFPLLEGCVNDVCGLENTLRDLGYCEVICLHDNAEEEPTKDNVEYHLEYLAGVMAKEDTLLVHFSCHGQLYENLPVLILKGVKMESQGLSIGKLREWMGNTGANKLVLSLDACYSGAAVGSRSGGDDQQFIENVYQNSEGFVTIASSRGQQKSQELVDRKNGLYSYYFIQGLKGSFAGQEKQSFVTARDIYNHILHNVRQECKKTPGISQDPMYDVGGCGEIILADYRTKKGLLVKLEPNLYQIDYHDARDKIDSIVGRLRRNSGPALFLLQNEKQVRGDLCLRYLRNRLDDIGIERREYPIGALDMGGDFSTTFAYKLADHLEVDCKDDCSIVDIIDKLCGNAMDYSYCILSIQIKQEDEQNPFLDWFLKKFWTLLSDRLQQMKNKGEDAVIVGILCTDRYLAEEQLSQTSCGDDVGGSDRKFFTLPISAWTEQDIKRWLRDYARPTLSSGECTGIADKVFQDTGGTPIDAWPAIQDIIQQLGRKESA